jgi:hypothetical protein
MAGSFVAWLAEDLRHLAGTFPLGIFVAHLVPFRIRRYRVGPVFYAATLANTCRLWVVSYPFRPTQGVP